MKKVVLKPGREKSVLRRHPWIFSGAIASGGEEAGRGETVEIVSAQGESLGFGSYSPDSQIRVRVASFDPNCPLDASLVSERVSLAVARRGLSSGYTNAARLVNAESDGLPGLVVDFYAGYAVAQFTSAGAEFWKETIADSLMANVSGIRSVSERADVDARRKEGLEFKEGLTLLGGEEPPGLIEIHEGAVKLFVDPRKGHKTGFYLDQREARRTVGEFAKGRRVLNAFSYTGGFGLHAAVGGAKSVVQVDISSDAIALAKRNAEATLGHKYGETMEFVEADVFKFLRSCRDAGKTFDMIVLDPPKFAESKAHLMKAARGYKDINLLAMKLLAPGGVLATFSCSGAMTEDLFAKILAEAAEDAGRDFQIAARTSQAKDHPVSLAFPEGLYLKGFILRRI